MGNAAISKLDSGNIDDGSTDMDISLLLPFGKRACCARMWLEIPGGLL